MNNGAMQVETTNLRLIAMPHILSSEKGRIDVTRPAGGSVNDLLRSIDWTPDSLNARVFIDGEYVKDAVWESTVPGAGQSVVVRAIPMGGAMGGGGGGGGKDATMIVAMVAVLALAVAAPYLAPVGWGLVGAWSGAALTATISIIGSLAVAATVPPPLPRLCDQQGGFHG